jgi:DNA-binding response OmpR family regulator
MFTLVVHPDAMIGKLLRFLLTEAGQEVVLLKSAQQCLRAVMEREPEAVLLTVALPDRDGFELCQQLRSQRYTGPLIMLTREAARLCGRG